MSYPPPPLSDACKLQPSAEPKSRSHEFDMMKGIAIMMVVMGHVICFGISEISQANIFKLIGSIHMPLFFFISGWFAVKSDKGRLLRPKIYRRFKQLIIPMLVVSAIWVWYNTKGGGFCLPNATYKGLWGDLWKYGYWFNLTLFELIVLYAFSVSVLNRFGSMVSAVTYVGIVWVLVYCISRLVEILPVNINGILGLPFIVKYWPCFMFGVLAQRWKNRFMKIVNSTRWQTAAILVGAFCLYYSINEEQFAICWLAIVFLPLLVPPVLHICLAVVAMSVFGRWSSQAFSGEKSARCATLWSYIGTNSLSIYLLHYFFLFPLYDFREALLAMNLGFTPLFFISFITAAIIIALVLGLIAVLRSSSLIYSLVGGTPQRKPEVPLREGDKKNATGVAFW